MRQIKSALNIIKMLINKFLYNYEVKIDKKITKSIVVYGNEFIQMIQFELTQVNNINIIKSNQIVLDVYL